MKKWYVVYTKYRKEHIALQNLIAQGYEAELPLCKVEKIIKNKKIIIEEPLFPRYLFIKLDEEGSQSWIPIRSTKGVSHLVRFNNLLAQLPEEVTKSIFSNKLDTIISESILPGDSVSIDKGPFKGIEALFDHFDGDKRAVLLLNILEKVVKGRFSLSEFTHIK